MDELLSKAMQGVDPAMPGAFWQVFMNLMGLVPWLQLTLWSLFFVAVGAGLGWFRGRTRAGILWAALLGPIGWIIVLLPPRKGGVKPPTLRRPPSSPPPLPPRDRR